MNINKKCPFKEIIKCQKQGIPKGICSICSANKYVIEATMEKALANDSDYVLIESTANQVNQFGGYIGMNPEDFKVFVLSIGKRIGFPLNRIILGGDHLGPYPWREEKADQAMEKACEMVRQYVLAGFNKIHIDTSILLADDPVDKELDARLIAERGATLCLEAEETFKKVKNYDLYERSPVYVIGTEVPSPGGRQEASGELKITKDTDFEKTVECYKDAFYKHNLKEAWENVIAVVIEPGVDFAEYEIYEYKSENTKDLRRSLEKFPNLVFEGHSTDYQKKTALKQMIKDGIAILKVGPAFTFALREALFILNYIENELFYDNPNITLSCFIDVLDKTMVENPKNWSKYYHGGDEAKLRLDRKYSLFDRCRYYLATKEVKNSIDLLIRNLNSIEIPLSLISQFLPLQYKKIRDGSLKNDPESLIKDKIIDVLDDYYYAVGD